MLELQNHQQYKIEGKLRFHSCLTLLAQVLVPCWIQFYLSSWINDPVMSRFSSVKFTHSVMSDSLRPHEPQHARPPCLSPTPGVHPNPCSLIQWCHPTISSSVVPFSSCPQSFQASRSFQMSQLFASGIQSIGVSASTSVLPMNTQEDTHGCTQ